MRKRIFDLEMKLAAKDAELLDLRARVAKGVKNPVGKQEVKIAGVFAPTIGALLDGGSGGAKGRKRKSETEALLEDAARAMAGPSRKP